MAKWGRGSKVPGYGRLLSKFDQSFSYSGGLIESCPKPGTFDHLPPFAIHILNPLDMRNHRDPLYMGQKCTQKWRETNTSQVFGNCGSLSSPPYFKLSPAQFKEIMKKLQDIRGISFAVRFLKRFAVLFTKKFVKLFTSLFRALRCANASQVFLFIGYPVFLPKYSGLLAKGYSGKVFRERLSSKNTIETSTSEIFISLLCWRQFEVRI